MKVYRMECSSSTYSGSRKGLRPNRLGIFSKYYPEWGRSVRHPLEEPVLSSIWTKQDIAEDFFFGFASLETIKSCDYSGSRMLNDSFIAVYEVIAPLHGETQVMFHKDLCRFIEEIPLSQFIRE